MWGSCSPSLHYHSQSSRAMSVWTYRHKPISYCNFQNAYGLTILCSSYSFNVVYNYTDPNSKSNYSATTACITSFLNFVSFQNWKNNIWSNELEIYTATKKVLFIYFLQNTAKSNKDERKCMWKVECVFSIKEGMRNGGVLLRRGKKK